MCLFSEGSLHLKGRKMQISKKSLILQANFFYSQKGEKCTQKWSFWNDVVILLNCFHYPCPDSVHFILDSIWGHSITKKYIKIVNHGKNVPKISQQHGTYCPSNIIISYSKYLTLIFSIYPWKSTNIADIIHPVYHFQFRVCHKIVCSCLHGNTEHILEFWVC